MRIRGIGKDGQVEFDDVRSTDFLMIDLFCQILGNDSD